LLPAKVLSLGFSMLQLAGLEIAFGMGVLAASTLLLPQLGRFLPKHAVPSTSLSLMAICLLSCALFSSFVALSILLAGMGIGLTCFNVTINAKRAMAIPVGYRATMESALLLACTAAAPFGFWVARVCVEKFGADAIITASGTLFLVAALSLARSLSLRRLLEASNDEVPHYLATNANLFLKGGS
jgi:DHA3 family macrolide efflux protein-like MFS transporter